MQKYFINNVVVFFILSLVITTQLKVGKSQEIVVTTEEQQDQDQEPEPTCPIYRTFDVDQPNTPQFGAPDGCRCVDGMQGLNCGYCTDDKPCQDYNSSHVCRSDMVFSEGDTYKGYNCRLFGPLEALFTNGKISLFVDILKKSASLSIYNTASINDQHAIDCSVTDCEFNVGGKGGKCDSIICNCTDMCSDWTKQIVESMLSGKPGEVVMEETEYEGEHHMKLAIEGAPLDIEALCNASSCSVDPNATIDTSWETLDSEWKTSATFSLIFLCIIAGIFLLLVCCAVVPLLLLGSKRLQLSKEEYQITDHGDDQPVAGSGGDKLVSSSPRAKHVLEFRHLSRVVRLNPSAAKAYQQKEKVILNNISGSVKSGNVLGLLGPSGAGKSSLLNILAAVESGSSRISGQILLNGKLQKNGYRKTVAYVQQDDSLYETLTVQECIEYSAMLRLPKSMNKEEKLALVIRTLDELHLSGIAHNRIGNSGKNNAGVSGGERKRVSIGMELVSQARVLVLDEPVSGLDSHAANAIINVLSELASRNRIVILSIHQPSMKSFLKMDQILLLGGGRVMYNGKPSEVERYLEDRGFPCPADETIPDHMLDVVSDKANREVLKGRETVASDYERLSGVALDEDSTESEELGEMLSMKRGSMLSEISILLARTSKDVFRNRELFLLQISISVVLALFAGGIFNDVSNNLAGFQNRMGAFYFTLSFFAFASFSSMDIFVKERHIFVRETGAKYHRAFSYFVSKIILDMFVLRVIPVTIFAFTFYWLMGLRTEPEIFIIFWATLVLFNVCAGIISICISIATSTVGQANLIAAVWFLIMLLFGGFLVNVQTMSPWYSWLKYVSIFYYSFELLMTNELSGLLLSFDAPGYPSLPIYGEVFLETIGMDTNNQTRDLICLCSLAAGFSVAAYLLLLLRVPPSAVRQFHKMQRENKRLARKSRSDANQGGEVVELPPKDETISPVSSSYYSAKSDRQSTPY